MNLLDRAMSWAVEHHAGQTDRAGVPYIAHICAVVAGVETVQEKIVAALHDIKEDCGVTHNELFINFGAESAEAVDAITKRDKEPYKEYLAVLWRKRHGPTLCYCEAIPTSNRRAG